MQGVSRHSQLHTGNGANSRQQIVAYIRDGVSSVARASTAQLHDAQWLYTQSLHLNHGKIMRSQSSSSCSSTARGKAAAS